MEQINDNMIYPSMKTDCGELRSWKEFKKELDDCLYKIRISKLAKMLPSAKIFEVHRGHQIHANLNRLFRKIDKEMAVLSNEILEKGIQDTPLDWLLKEDEIWRSLPYLGKIQRIERMCQRTEASSNLKIVAPSVKPDRPQFPNDLMSFYDSEEELDELLASYIFEEDPKKMLRSSNKFAEELVSIAIKCQNDPHLEILHKDVTKVLSDQVSVIIMGPRIFGTYDKSSILEVGIFKKQDFFNDYLQLTGDYVMDHIDLLLTKSDKFVLKKEKINDRKVTVKHVLSNIKVNLWRKETPDLKKIYLKTQVLKFLFQQQPEFLKFYLFLTKWFVMALKWPNFSENVLVGLILIYLVEKKLMVPIHEVLNSLTGPNKKKIDVEWDGLFLDDWEFTEIFTTFSNIDFSLNLKPMENFKNYLQDFFNFFSSQYPVESFEFDCIYGTIRKRKPKDFDCMIIVLGFTRGWIFCEDLPTLSKFMKDSAKIMKYVR